MFCIRLSFQISASSRPFSGCSVSLYRLSLGQDLGQERAAATQPGQWPVQQRHRGPTPTHRGTAEHSGPSSVPWVLGKPPRRSTPAACVMFQLRQAQRCGGWGHPAFLLQRVSLPEGGWQHTEPAGAVGSGLQGPLQHPAQRRAEKPDAAPRRAARRSASSQGWKPETNQYLSMGDCGTGRAGQENDLQTVATKESPLVLCV